MFSILNKSLLTNGKDKNINGVCKIFIFLLPLRQKMLTESEKNLITKYAGCDVNTLALKLHDTNEIRSKMVLQQIAGRELMKKKMPLWAENPDIIYPVHLPLEQCSSVFTAGYKKEIAEKLVKDFSLFTDLTGGFGVDFFVISEKFKKAVYNERKADLCEIVRHNFKVLNRMKNEGEQSQEYAMLYDYAELLANLPWKKQQAEKMKVEQLLEEKADHLKLVEMKIIKKMSKLIN